MKKNSIIERHQYLQSIFSSQTPLEFDLFIVGGGITGAGTAREAAMRGMRVFLADAGDFAGGTSSRSSKLVHGGIRYLENLEFKLVFEALNERTRLFQMVPPLIHPLRFMIPLYKSSRVSMFKMGLGMWLYDALALFQAPELHERLSPQETLDRMPAIQSHDLVGSYVYSDAYMDDDRLVHETLRSAHKAGAQVVNYTQVINVKKISKQKYEIEIKDLLSGKSAVVYSKGVVSSVGPWTDIFASSIHKNWKKILRPTKGIHLTFHKSRLPLENAVVMAAEKSNRIVFGIPRHEMIIIGTTDTDFTGDPRNVKVETEDVDYLLKIVNDYFPGGKLTKEDIVSSYAGVRPLVHDGSSNESKTSREHTIFTNEDGIVFVAGGKYTTYRLMSEEIIEKALEFYSTEDRVKFNSVDTTQPLFPHYSVERYNEALRTCENWPALKLILDDKKNLALRFGDEALDLIHERPQYNYWQLEAYYAISRTMCLNLTDFYVRRVPLFLSTNNHGLHTLEEVLVVFDYELQLGKEELQKQVKDYIAYIEDSKSWERK